MDFFVSQENLAMTCETRNKKYEMTGMRKQALNTCEENLHYVAQVLGFIIKDLFGKLIVDPELN